MTRHGHYPMGGENPPRSVAYEQGKFGRLFPTLPPIGLDTPTLRAALMELGQPGGRMDAGDDLSDPVALLTDPARSVNNPNNPDLSAGMTFLGQFLDHDLTFDPTSSLERQVDPEAISNFRTPALELDSVYGSGPGATPHLYDQQPADPFDRGIKLLTEAIDGCEAVSRGGVTRHDLPRNRQGVALTGDPRNDENLIVSQLHLALLRFHNAAVDHVRAELGAAARPAEVFMEAQRLVRWHYQWMIVHEFLPKTCGPGVVQDVLESGRKFYKWRNAPYIPVEFSVAAYRFGHSQVRPSYRANFGADDAGQFVGLILDASLPPSLDPDDLRGEHRAPRRFVDWQTFFDFGDGRVKPNKKIDTRLSSVLFALPGFGAGDVASLAQRNLLRQLTFSVPSGQRVARAMKLDELLAADLDDLKDLHLEARTPLWYYILREADVQQGGKRLGAVGARIVTEVFVGVLEGDHTSYLALDPEWTPIFGQNGDFGITDLLSFAGVVVEF